MAYLYSWGASVVMIGALMKLEHFPLSSYFLIAGLGTEAVIFFFAAFEPLPEDWEWDRVYPELADKNTKIEKKVVAKPAAYRLGDAVAVMVGTELSNGIRAGISYDFTTSAIGSYSNGSVEFVLGYNLEIGTDKYSQRYKSVRFL